MSKLETVQTAADAYKRYQEFLSTDSLIQSNWHDEAEDGRHLACALSVIGEGVKGIRDCPAQITPRWLAQMVPWLFDGQSRENAFDWGSMFLETSRRSGVTYMFRKLRPTVAITMRGTNPRILAALRMHPIGYYDGSWAGAMCPTDDVIAHLSLMRGDEPMFWRRCNQHAPWRAEAGL